MPVKVIMPKLGESVVDGTVNRWIKHEGDPVEEFESLLEVETAKVTTEIPSPAAGVVLKIISSRRGDSGCRCHPGLGWSGRGRST